MTQIRGSVDVRLSLDDVNKINELIERDTAKAIVQKKIGQTILECCPYCGKMQFSRVNFCSECGQRIDADNIALEGGE